MIKIHPIPFIDYYFPVVADQFFDYEFGKNNWYWSSIEEADFFATMSGEQAILNIKREQWDRYKKPIVHLHIQHYDDGQENAFNNWSTHLTEYSYIVCDLLIKESPSWYIFTQFSQNVVRSYAQNFQFTFPFQKFYYTHPKAFSSINKNFDPNKKTKIFISANKTYESTIHRQCLIRKQIIDLTYNRYRHLGHIGNKDGLGIWLADNTFDASTIDELVAQTQDKNKIIAFGQNYPHILYFQDTFISFYGETYEGKFGNKSLGVTEKSWIPMMQGHFIMPFGSAGIIDYLKTLKFKFPIEINYDYDNEENYQTRTEKYLEEINRLCNLSLNTWKDIYYNNAQILQNNQSLILDDPIYRCGLLEKIGIERT